MCFVYNLLCFGVNIMRYPTTINMVLLTMALISVAEGVSRRQRRTVPATCGHYVDNNKRIYDCSGTEVIIEFETVSINCEGQPLDCPKLQDISINSKNSLKYLEIRNCSVNTSLECVLDTLDVPGTRTLKFEAVSSPITTEMMRGLHSITNLFIKNGVQNQVPVDVIKLLPNLRMLRLFANGMTTLPSNIFNQVGVPNLNFLLIVRNNISTAPEDAFKGLNKLKTLHFSENNIEKVDVNTFRGLDSLEYLNLEQNRFSSLPAGLFLHTPELLKLLMNDNQAALRLQTGVLSGLVHLKTLDLQNSLELHLEPRSLSNLPALESLEMQESGITSLPADLFHNTTNLINLTLSKNNISSLPETVFEGLKNLNKLDLTDNQLMAVTKNMFQPLQSITELLLDGNHISALPTMLFYSLRNLKTVSLSNNHISEVNKMTFLGMYLLNLDLSRNKLAWSCNINGAFRYESPLKLLSGLDTLNISRNYISSVCSDWTSTLTSLSSLDLSFNNLTSIKKDDINFHRGNITVNLRDNQIATIEVPRYPPEKNTRLLLGRNPFHCNCHLYEFLKQSQEPFYNMEDAVCALPASMKGRRLNNSLLLNELTCPLANTPEGCICIVRPKMSRTECDCISLRNKTLPNPADNGRDIETMLLRLQTQDNLKNISRFVKELDLSGLGLETVPDFPKSVHHVDLRNNKLSTVPLEILRRNITLLLSGNRIKCDCWSQKDVGNLKNNLNKINDYKSVYCEDGGELEQVDVPRLCNVFYAIVIGTSLGVIGLIVAIVGTVVYKYSLEIKIYLYYRGFTWLVKEEMLDVNKEYDIFLSYVHQDVEFVKKNIQAVLDKDYKVCVHDRDWIVGDRIEDQIYRSVAQSRRTIIMLSNAFIESNSWALTEFEAAHAQTIVDQLPRAVVILLEDVNSDNAPDHIKRHMKTNTYIQWGDSMFWERLRYALPKKMKAKDVRRRQVAAQAAKKLAKGGLNVEVNEMGDLVNVGALQNDDSDCTKL